MIGDMKHLCWIVTQVRTTDTGGGFAQTYNQEFQFWASVTPTGGRKDQISDGLKTNRRKSITCRRDTRISQGQIVLYDDGMYYRIMSMENKGDDNFYWEMDLEKIGDDTL